MIALTFLLVMRYSAPRYAMFVLDATRSPVSPPKLIQTMRQRIFVVSTRVLNPGAAQRDLRQMRASPNRCVVFLVDIKCLRVVSPKVLTKIFPDRCANEQESHRQEPRPERKLKAMRVQCPENGIDAPSLERMLHVQGCSHQTSSPKSCLLNAPMENRRIDTHCALVGSLRISAPDARKLRSMHHYLDGWITSVGCLTNILTKVLSQIPGPRCVNRELSHRYVLSSAVNSK